MREPPRRSSSKHSVVEDGADSQDSESSTSVAGGSTTAVAAAPRRHDNETIQRLTELLRHVDGNDRCVDCGSRKPLWVSLNLGVLLCIECCGVHRQLGSHISKVRSLALDRWDVEAIAYLTHVGNTLANQARRVTLSIVSRTLQPTASRDERSSYIKAKYAPPATRQPPAADFDKMCELLWANRPKRDMLELQRLLGARRRYQQRVERHRLAAAARARSTIAAALNSTVYVELLLNWGAVIDERVIQIANDRNALLHDGAAVATRRHRRRALQAARRCCVPASRRCCRRSWWQRRALVSRRAVARRLHCRDALRAAHRRRRRAARRRTQRLPSVARCALSARWSSPSSALSRTAAVTLVVPELRALVKALQSGATRVTGARRRPRARDVCAAVGRLLMESC
jgi:hypothetical protein